MQAKYKGLPVYIIDFTDDTIFNNCSLVEYPAIEENFLKFSSQQEMKFSVDQDKREVFGPALLPEQLIYRRNGDYEYYVKFDADAIKKFAIEFFRSSKQNEGNIEHAFPVKGITFYQSFISDKAMGIVPKDYENLPDGTWFLGAKIDNDEVWEAIKAGEIRGFSVDIYTSLSPAKEEKKIDTLEELVDYLEKIA